MSKEYTIQDIYRTSRSEKQANTNWNDFVSTKQKEVNKAGAYFRSQKQSSTKTVSYSPSSYGHGNWRISSTGYKGYAYCPASGKKVNIIGSGTATATVSDWKHQACSQAAANQLALNEADKLAAQEAHKKAVTNSDNKVKNLGFCRRDRG